MFIREHQELAGFVAWDLAAWQYWGAAPLYFAIIKSNVRQHFASHVAIFKYLQQSPAGNKIDLDVSKTGASDQTSAERSAIPMLPQ
jgi:hypothetical protein